MSFRGLGLGLAPLLASVALGACSSSSPGVRADAGQDSGQDTGAADSAIGATSDGSADGGDGAAFVGSWTCTGTQTLTFTTPTNVPMMMQTSPAYALAISMTMAGLSATLDGCTFSFTVSGDTATGAPPGQMCATGSLLPNNPKGSSDSTYTTATMTLTSPTTLTGSGSFAFTDSAVLGDGGRELYAGTGTYSTTCHKP